ncbi:hypothetical protein CRE_23643 [Caenorhabditis remanei]|uniref:Uncharacterized protein n=1 Tax=Caenorhabditis remanei TaxID=31234 RepID=E3N489_CAERE|nr:hypothetical protein CRE_23643 [Caenorhabditis remanei]
MVRPKKRLTEDRLSRLGEMEVVRSADKRRRTTKPAPEPSARKVLPRRGAQKKKVIDDADDEKIKEKKEDKNTPGTSKGPSSVKVPRKSRNKAKKFKTNQSPAKPMSMLSTATPNRTKSKPVPQKNSEVHANIQKLLMQAADEMKLEEEEKQQSNAPSGPQRRSRKHNHPQKIQNGVEEEEPGPRAPFRAPVSESKLPPACAPIQTSIRVPTQTSILASLRTPVNDISPVSNYSHSSMSIDIGDDHGHGSSQESVRAEGVSPNSDHQNPDTSIDMDTTKEVKTPGRRSNITTTNTSMIRPKKVTFLRKSINYINFFFQRFTEAERLSRVGEMEVVRSADKRRRTTEPAPEPSAKKVLPRRGAQKMKVIDDADDEKIKKKKEDKNTPGTSKGPSTVKVPRKSRNKAKKFKIAPSIPSDQAGSDANPIVLDDTPEEMEVIFLLFIRPKVVSYIRPPVSSRFNSKPMVMNIPPFQAVQSYNDSSVSARAQQGLLEKE